MIRSNPCAGSTQSERRSDRAIEPDSRLALHVDRPSPDRSSKGNRRPQDPSPNERRRSSVRDADRERLQLFASVQARAWMPGQLLRREVPCWSAQ
jgi:hypothetical protein